jgi:hypothetical protein
VTGGSQEATGTPRSIRDANDDAFVGTEPMADPVAESSAVGSTRFAHASEAEMARILDFYAVRWEYEPTTFPILWNLGGEVVESFAPDFYLPELGMFLEMTTLKQRLVRKKNRKLRRLRELYPDIRIKLFYARDFRAMLLKYGRLALAEALSGTPGQVVAERPAPAIPTEDEAPVPLVVPVADVIEAPSLPIAEAAPSALPTRPLATAAPRKAPRPRPGRRRRRPVAASQGAAEQAERETGA